MKRFVKEFAEHEIQSMRHNPYFEKSYVMEHEQKIRNVVTACEQGMISEAQACWSIAEQTR